MSRSKQAKTPYRILYRLAAALLLIVLPLRTVCSGPAGIQAHAAEEGYWYLEDFGIYEAHDAGITGEGVKIADVDTMINLNLPWMSDVDIVLRDQAITKFYGDVPPESDDFMMAFHSTDMVGLLQGNGEGAYSGKAQVGIVPGATIYHYAAVTSEDDEVTGGDIYDEAVRLALEDDVDIILIPAGGKSDYEKQYPYILEAIKRGIPVLVAHANNRVRLDQDTRPEMYTDAQGGDLYFEELLTADWADEICYWPGIVTVQALDETYRLQVLSRIEDSGTDIAAPGEGIWMQQDDWGIFEPIGGNCSAATTAAVGYLALAMQKWPEATGNQILQLMARTTGPQSEAAFETNDMDITELTIDPFYGWGALDVMTMLNTDPTGFPDVNPVLYKDVSQFVRNAQIRGDSEMIASAELREITEVLDEQLELAGLERPDFVKTVLGEERSAQSEPEEQDTENDPQDTASADTSVSTGSTEDTHEQTPGPAQETTPPESADTAEPEAPEEPKMPKGPDEAGVRLSPLAPALAAGAFVLSLTGLIVSRALIRGRRRRKQQQIRKGAEYAE